MLHRISRTYVTLATMLLCTGLALGQGADIPCAITFDENGYAFVAVSSVNSKGQTAMIILAYDTEGNLWREFQLPGDPAGPMLATGIDLIDSMIVFSGSGAGATTGRDIITAAFARPGLLSVDPAHNVANSFRLEQHYPNPLPPGVTATIKYEIPVSSEVRLTVLDMLGREIAVLAEGFHEKGSYETQYIPSRLPAGSYLIVLSSDATSEVRKLVLLR